MLLGRRRRRAPPSRTRSRRSHRGQPLAPAESRAPDEPTSGKTAACRDQEEQLEVMPGRSPLGVMPSLEGEDAAGGTSMTARRAHVPEKQLGAAASASSVRCCCESRPPELLLDAEAAAGWGQAQAGILSCLQTIKKFRSTNVMVVGMLCSGIGLFGFQLRSEKSKVAYSKSAVLLETCDFEKLQFLEE